MTDAPERIWVDPGAWEIVAAKTKIEPDYDVQYIRADIHDAAVSAARKDGMLEAARIADQHRDPTGTEYGEGWDASASSIASEIRARTETSE